MCLLKLKLVFSPFDENEVTKSAINKILVGIFLDYVDIIRRYHQRRYHETSL